MQIRLRPSGGRGEYELAGSHGNVRGSDLYGLELQLEFGLDLRIPLYAVADIHEGKPRIRLHDPHNNAHAAKIIAALLLLPQPIREIRLAGGSATDIDFQRCAYSAIGVDIVKKNPSEALLRPRVILAINAQGARASMDVLERFAFIQRVWAGLPNASAELQDAIAAHQVLANTTPLNHKALLAAASRVLETPQAWLFLAPGKSFPLPDADLSMALPPLSEDDPSSPIETNRDLRKRLAWKAERGPEGRRFRQEVMRAYDFKCAFTGSKLPPLGKTYSPGVDAAHIYPWSLKGSNDVCNGISLSKQMHWAFDEGILRLRYAPTDAILLLDMPSEIASFAARTGFDLIPYLALCGSLPKTHLPQDSSQWPSRTALKLYNELMFPDL